MLLSSESIFIIIVLSLGGTFLMGCLKYRVKRGIGVREGVILADKVRHELEAYSKEGIKVKVPHAKAHKTTYGDYEVFASLKKPHTRQSFRGYFVVSKRLNIIGVRDEDLPEDSASMLTDPYGSGELWKTLCEVFIEQELKHLSIKSESHYQRERGDS